MVERSPRRPFGMLSTGLFLCLLALVLATVAQGTNGGGLTGGPLSQHGNAGMRHRFPSRQLRLARLRQSLEAQRLGAVQTPLWLSLNVPELPTMLPSFDEASVSGSSGSVAQRPSPFSLLRAQESQQEREARNALSWQRGRLLQSSPAAQAPAPSANASANASALRVILAQSRTERVNPLDSFRVYRSGWNPSSSSYWAVSGRGGRIVDQAPLMPPPSPLLPPPPLPLAEGCFSLLTTSCSPFLLLNLCLPPSRPPSLRSFGWTW